MKKLLLLPSLFFTLSAFAYTTEDASNARYLAEKGIVKQRTNDIEYRLDDKVLRQEVIGMALKLKGISLPDNYTCKKYFADAIKNDWVCRAVEIAADNGIITRSNKNANPGKYITRSEALGMLMKAGDVSYEDNIPWTKYYENMVSSQWQLDIVLGGVGAGIVLQPEKFGPNINAKRAEVFAYIDDIIRGSEYGEFWQTFTSKDAGVEFKFPKTHCSGDWCVPGEQKVFADSPTIGHYRFLFTNGDINNDQGKSAMHIFNAQNKDEIDKIIKKQLGSTCHVASETEIKPGVIRLTPRNEFEDEARMMECFLNYILIVQYYPEHAKLLIWSIGHDFLSASDDVKNITAPRPYQERVINSIVFLD